MPVASQLGRSSGVSIHMLQALVRSSCKAVGRLIQKFAIPVINPWGFPVTGFFDCRCCFNNGYVQPLLSERLLVFILYLFYPLCSLIVTLFFLPYFSPEVLKSFFPRWLRDFYDHFPKFTIVSFRVFFKHFVLGVKLSSFLKVPYSPRFS